MIIFYPDAFNEIYKYMEDESDLILFGHNSETHMVKVNVLNLMATRNIRI